MRGTTRMQTWDRAGIAECLRRLNDPEEQARAYPLLDEFEENIDLAGTDILHGWLYSGPHGTDVTGEPFADAFANAFRVMVLRRAAVGVSGRNDVHDVQPVFRRVGWSGSGWVWQHTSVITSWAIEMGVVRGGRVGRLVEVERLLGDERLFPDGAAAWERVRDILTIGGEQGGGSGTLHTGPGDGGGILCPLCRG
jgi:hypothetical protein